jgi:hypothetical protein
MVVLVPKNGKAQVPGLIEGNSPRDMTLNDAIDDPAYRMINCAHTSHVASVLDPSSVKLWRRIG